MLKKTKNKMKLPSVQLIGFTVLALTVTGFLAGAKPAIQQEVLVGICAECHEDVCADFKLVRHAAIKTDTWVDQARQEETICINCHGDPTEHLEVGGGPDTIFTFKETMDAQAKTDKCLNCHTRTRGRFFASPHGKAAMDCTNCHDELMKATAQKKSSTKICVSCHEDVLAKFNLNERHRLQEGILDCTTCHDQHAPSARGRLGGFKHQECLKCHTDKGGPYLYEHGASRIEGCSACHEVHGSPNRHLLTHQSTSDLCFSCHTFAPDWHSRFGSTTTNCSICHATIHGSNLSKLFLK